MLAEFDDNFRPNLFKPLLLFFDTGLHVPILGVEFEFPHIIYQGLTIYLLVSIGWHGGELAKLEPKILTQALEFMGVGFLTNFVIGVTAYVVFRAFTKLRRVDAATVAGYYGSDSAGTFITSADDKLFLDMFQGLLCLFLLEMGMTASRKLKDLKRGGVPFIVFGLLAPVAFASFGIVVAHLFSMAIHQELQLGTYVLFSVLCAAASSIAVPTVQRLAIPEASPTLPRRLARVDLLLQRDDRDSLVHRNRESTDQGFPGHLIIL